MEWLETVEEWRRRERAARDVAAGSFHARRSTGRRRRVASTRTGARIGTTRCEPPSLTIDSGACAGTTGDACAGSRNRRRRHLRRQAARCGPAALMTDAADGSALKRSRSATSAGGDDEPGADVGAEEQAGAAGEANAAKRARTEVRAVCASVASALR